MKAGGRWHGPWPVARPRRRPVTHTQGVDTWGLRWLDQADGPAVVLLDQTRLPAEETYLTCTGGCIAGGRDPVGLVVRGAVAGAGGRVRRGAGRLPGEDVAQAAAALARPARPR